MSHTPRRKASCGRQDFAFALQRFVSSRDGPNVRQSFTVWADCAC
nr:alginate export family protein [Rhizobium ruizarguesonis]